MKQTEQRVSAEKRDLEFFQRAFKGCAVSTSAWLWAQLDHVLAVLPTHIFMPSAGTNTPCSRQPISFVSSLGLGDLGSDKQKAKVRLLDLDRVKKRSTGVDTLTRQGW